MKITLPITALAAILGLALAGVPVSVQAQTTATGTTTPAAATTKASKATKYSGTLTAVDTTANTIAISDKTLAPRTFTITATTKIKKDGKIATLADFKVGDKVGGSYTTDAAGTMTATTLSTGAAKPKTTKAKPTTTTTTAPATPAAQ